MNGRSYFRLITLTIPKDTQAAKKKQFSEFLKLFAPPITFFDERRGFISAQFMFPTRVSMPTSSKLGCRARKFSGTIGAAENSYLLRSCLMQPGLGPSKTSPLALTRAMTVKYSLKVITLNI